MFFEGYAVPGAEWVEIVSIRNKDGTPLAENNWRRNLFGRISLCWVAGGFRRRGLFFKGKIRMVHGNPVVLDLHSSSWCSTTEAQPVEVEPGVFEMETNTSIYQLRILSEEEVQAVMDTVEIVLQKELEARFGVTDEAEVPPVGAGPVS